MSLVMNQQKLGFNTAVTNYYPEILTDEAMEFLILLHENFNAQRISLLERRKKEQNLFNKGKKPGFPVETKAIREGNWMAGSIPSDLKDRRVEITGPTDRKMMINALNSGAKTFMADLEDSTSPTWRNVLDGQINLRDAVSRTISFKNNTNGKRYQLNEQTATLLVRPRGWHLNEKHLLINKEEASASLVDFGLFFFHNAKQLLKNGTGPYFYLPKLEHYLEARLWNDVFVFAQDYLGIPKGTIKATVLIETITASFQLDEFIFELKDHIVGLNCGRWDYIFSYIKKLRAHDLVTPDRAEVTMQTPFMKAYSLRVIQICHKRGIHAIGGMAAQIPIKEDDAANNAALEKVRRDKEAEVLNGHDGTWVAHPALVAIAMEVFNTHMPEANQIEKQIEGLTITAEDLIEQPEGQCTEAGVRKNINVGILYLLSWLNGNGAAALYHLMEDAATAEISRAQLWQWLKHKVVLEDGRTLTKSLYTELRTEELKKVEAYITKSKMPDTLLGTALQLFDDLVLADTFEDFLTTKAYAYL
ncbi:malate synthase A [Ulvibacter litoralis]|uniref:Malate synthase n=1 Tax=Ulvibacter litoralis TaxID=227084 RepID=A0A1G7FBT7_9FLAO|nr:malate synthase A [Ulvibacter litoralis]GHC51990.1 malate synthase [Ulvibacter litoralis]SDE72935.1 malate synthase [Ulvibacter litoralis]